MFLLRPAGGFRLRAPPAVGESPGAARAGVFPQGENMIGLDYLRGLQPDCPEEDWMTKSELIDAVARRSQITKSRAELVVNCVFDSMTAALERGEGIEIRGFGSFTVREYKPYNGRNPRTGRAVPVPEKRLPFFKVGKELKELVNAGEGAIETDDEDTDTEHQEDENDGDEE
ncbi:MAG TPA: HU family DNA-binding protein [Polyangiales bacterium]